jgi:hypothetical protein
VVRRGLLTLFRYDPRGPAMTRPSKRTLLILAAAFVAGTCIGYTLLRTLEVRATSLEFLLWPGFVLLVVVGGLHSASPWSIAPLNGIGYALIVGFGVWLKRSLAGRGRR